ncbi:MAG: amidase [Aquabacterium sp.]|nr:amidase [Aquabacterium sp.]
MRFDEYRQHDGLGLASLVRKREVSARELVALAIDRMNAVNPALNAIVTRMDEQAAARAASDLSGPFAGVPFVLKDIMQAHAGVRTCMGSAALRQHVPQAHEEMTRRWLAAGVVPVGVSNASEFGLKPQTESRLWGAVHNPWRPGLSAGGSSGGSAAAVAAGMVPMAGGNDIGGSIRLPAALCGLFGFKPGRGRTPWSSTHAEIAQGAAVQHVLTRSVRDSAAMLDATCAPFGRAAFHVAPPARSYSAEVERSPGRLRVGFSRLSPLGMPVDADCTAAVDQCARLLAGLGHDVQELTPPLAWADLYEDVMIMMYTTAAAMVREVRMTTGCKADAFESDTRLMAAVGRMYAAVELLASQARWAEYLQGWQAFRSQCDVWLTPVVTQAALPLGAFRTPGWQTLMAHVCLKIGLGRAMLRSDGVRQSLLEVLNYVAFTTPVNLMGLPAMSVPLYQSADGLPLAVQLVGGVGEEGLLFNLAAQLELAQPWFGRVPMRTDQLP